MSGDEEVNTASRNGKPWLQSLSLLGRAIILRMSGQTLCDKGAMHVGLLGGLKSGNSQKEACENETG